MVSWASPSLHSLQTPQLIQTKSTPRPGLTIYRRRCSDSSSSRSSSSGFNKLTRGFAICNHVNGTVQYAHGRDDCYDETQRAPRCTGIAASHSGPKATTTITVSSYDDHAAHTQTTLISPSDDDAIQLALTIRLTTYEPTDDADKRRASSSTSCSRSNLSTFRFDTFAHAAAHEAANDTNDHDCNSDDDRYVCGGPLSKGSLGARPVSFALRLRPGLNVSNNYDDVTTGINSVAPQLTPRSLRGVLDAPMNRYINELLGIINITVEFNEINAQPIIIPNIRLQCDPNSLDLYANSGDDDDNGHNTNNEDTRLIHAGDLISINAIIPIDATSCILVELSAGKLLINQLSNDTNNHMADTTRSNANDANNSFHTPDETFYDIRFVS